MSLDSKEVETDFPFLKVYKDGTVERLFGSPYVPPSLDDPITNVSTKDVTISTNVSARIYLPKITDPSRKLPVLVYFHGGAFCLESAFSFLNNRYLKQMVSKSHALAISVEYRLAPEHPLPAAYEDSWAALQWVASHAVEEYSNNINEYSKEPWLINYGDFDKLYIGGDSAGGNIAYNMAMRGGVESLACGVKILGAFLCCPSFCDSKTKKGSEEESLSYKIWSFIFPSAPGGINNPLMNPFAEDENLSGMGCEKLFLFCADKDKLREINLRFVEELKRSGWEGEVEVVDVEGEDHCFQFLEPDTEKAQSLISRLASFIKG